MNTAQIAQEIEEWAAGNRESWQKYDDPIEVFVYRVENWGDVVLPSGKVEFVDIDQNDDESFFVFNINGTDFAVTGSYSSWGSDWDSGVIEVGKRTVMIDRWERL